MNEVVIRRMEPADIDGVLEVERKSFAAPWSRMAFETELAGNDLAHYFVAELDGRIIGYSGLWIVLNEAHITNVAVLPAYRRRGLGEALLATMAVFAKAHDVTSMTLEVRKSNIDAQRLYLRQGFVPRGVRRGYYADTKEDAVIMWRDVL